MLSFPTVILACTLASFARAAVIQDHQASLNPTSFVTALCGSSNLKEKIQLHDCYTAFLAFPFEKSGSQLKSKEPSLQSVSGTCNITMTTSDHQSFDVSAGRLLHGKGDKKNGGLKAILAQCHEEAGAIMIEGGTLGRGGNIKLSVNPAIGSDMAQCAKADGLQKLDEEDCRTAFLDLPFDCEDEKLKVNTSSISGTENGCTVTITALAGQTIEVSSGRLLDGADGNGGIDALFKQCGDLPGSITIEGGATHETNVKISIKSSKDQLLSPQKRSLYPIDTNTRPSENSNSRRLGPIIHVNPLGMSLECASPELEQVGAQIDRRDCEKALDSLSFRGGKFQASPSTLTLSHGTCKLSLWTSDGKSLGLLSRSDIVGKGGEMGLSKLFFSCGLQGGKLTVKNENYPSSEFKLGAYVSN